MKYSIFTHIGVLIGDKEANAILQRYLGDEVMSQLSLSMARGMSLSGITKFFGEAITHETLNTIDEELRKI